MAPPYVADFANLDDVCRLANQLTYPKIDILVNNAGLMSRARTSTADCHELTFQVNYLAPFLLTWLLMDRLQAAPDARVITTASSAHTRARLILDDLDYEARKYKMMRVYGTSKLANILFTQELARRTRGSSVTASAFNPGPIASDLFRAGGLVAKAAHSPLGKAIMSPPEKGALPLVHLATVADAPSVNGKYFDGMKPSAPMKTSPDLAARLWKATERLARVQMSDRDSRAGSGP